MLPAEDAYDGPKEKLHIYLLAGGSTMAGTEPLTDADKAVLERCYLLNDEGEWEPARAPLNRYSSIRSESAKALLGPGLSFARAMLEQDKSISIGLVVNAGRGKQNLVEHWRYKDHCYREARRRTKMAMKTGTLKGVLWTQDGTRIDSALSYLKDFAGNLRIDMADLNLPVVVSGAGHQGSICKGFAADIHAAGFAGAGDRKSLGQGCAEAMQKIQQEWSARPVKLSPTMKVIDAHVHATPCKKDGLDIVAQWMERNGVERCISKPLRQSRAKTEEQRAIMLANFKKYEGRIYRFCLIEPDEVKTVEEAVAILEKEKAEGAIGFGEHYGHDRLFDDPTNLRLYAACEKVGLPVHFHIDNNKNMDEKGLPRLERVLKMFPKCKLIAHAQFWLHLADGTCDRLLQTYPNLYAEPSGLRMAAVLNRDRKYTRQFLIRNADKILFGTDAGWWSFGKAKADREIQFALFEQFDLPEEVKTKIYRTNAEKLFGFEK